MAEKRVPITFEAQAIAAFGGRLAFAVSGGKDSAVMLNLMSKYTDLKKHKFFFWSCYPEMLPYQRRYVEMVEKLYEISIDIRIWPERYKGKQADFVKNYLEENGCSLCCFGYRMDESLQRRGMRAFFLREFIGEEDYQCAIRQDPNVEIDYVRITSDPEFWENAKRNIEKDEG